MMLVKLKCSYIMPAMLDSVGKSAGLKPQPPFAVRQTVEMPAVYQIVRVGHIAAAVVDVQSRYIKNRLPHQQ